MTNVTRLFLDIEVYHGFFYLGMKRQSDGLRRGFEMSRRHNDPETIEGYRTNVRAWLKQFETVGFNSLGYDLPLIWYWLDGADNEDLKSASDRIIQGNVKWWDVEDMLDIRIPWSVKDQHIDLIEPQPNPFASLKILNGRLHGKQMQDLPFDPALWPNEEEMDILADYCLHSDLDATENVWNACEGAIDLRRSVSKQIGKNVLSKSDTQMGLAIVKKRYEQRTKKKLKGGWRATPGKTFRYSAPDYIEFETPVLKEILGRIQEHQFVVNAKGKVDLPDWLKEADISFGDTSYAMGIGGLHSKESNRAIRSTSTHVLCDFDVASYYPAIILNTGLYPESMGSVFADIYREIRDERIRAKKAKDKVTDKSLKIALNGTFGSLGSPFSFVYAPHLLISVTLTGQLALLLLIERLEMSGFHVVSGNTDGVVVQIPVEKWDGLDGDRPRPSELADIVEGWERDTGFTLEGNEYRALYNQSVNSYWAITKNGKVKRKGPFANPWHPDEPDLRSQMMKNPQMTICSDAAVEKILTGKPVEETIRECEDFTQFVTVIKADGGATWNDEYLGKVVRFYWSTEGQPIFKAKAHASTGVHPKVPKTDGARECMRLPDTFPDDVDYDRYVEEAERLLREFGFYGNALVEERPIRLTKARGADVLRAWVVAP